MSEEEILRFAHVVGAAVLFGTGAGIAFFMLMARQTRDPALIAHVSGTMVIADFLFTATAVVAQPVTGIWLAMLVGWPLSTPWIVVSIGLYIFSGLLWLPVVWIQIRLRDLARKAASEGAPLPAEFDRLYKIWFASGWPAFAAVLGIMWLMVNRPDFTLF